MLLARTGQGADLAQWLRGAFLSQLILKMCRDEMANCRTYGLRAVEFNGTVEFLLKPIPRIRVEQSLQHMSAAVLTFLFPTW